MQSLKSRYIHKDSFLGLSTQSKGGVQIGNDFVHGFEVSLIVYLPAIELAKILGVTRR